MVMLKDEDILTREVLHWKGIHLLHFRGSSCSQKTRVFLSLKKISWDSHHVDLVARENYSDWFMGINPRGLVPVLVDNGKVIIESNDILTYLEAKFPEPRLIPDRQNEEASILLDEEDALHLDLRAICFRYFFPGVEARPEALLEQYERSGSGTVEGVADQHKLAEVAFHRDVIENNGISDQRIREATVRFHGAFSGLEQRLADSAYILGDHVSLVDIAWYIYGRRLFGSGYPLHRLHPRLGRWYDGLDAQDEFNREVAEPPMLIEMREVMQKQQASEGTTLAIVAGLET